MDFARVRNKPFRADQPQRPPARDRQFCSPTFVQFAASDAGTSAPAGGVRFRRRINGDQATGEMGKQAAVVVPVTVILMPSPRTTGLGFFEDHLVVVVIDLVAQEQTIVSTIRRLRTVISQYRSRPVRSRRSLHGSHIAVGPRGRPAAHCTSARRCRVTVRPLPHRAATDDEESLIVECSDLFYSAPARLIEWLPSHRLYQTPRK